MVELHQKERISLRYWLLGAGYTQAARAMEYAAGYHRGLRKDLRTPEFQHQVQIAQYIRTLVPALSHPEATLVTVFLHDVPEDYDVPLDDIEQLFGAQVRRATWLLTKKHQGMVKSPEVYFQEMADDPIASIVKAGDRMHNFGSMVGVFTEAKQEAYIAECEQHILPMLKGARRRFPEQEPAYENLKHMLLTQIELIRAIHAAAA